MMLNRLFELIERADRVVAFTGAGISTLSGIPDFRGETGVFALNREGIGVEELHEINFFMRHPDRYYEHARDFVYNLDDREPNIVHRVLADMERGGRLGTVYTQNIDGLHHRAGSREVEELHGSMLEHYCMDCHKEFDYAEVAGVVRSGEVPRCSCGGLIRPGIVFFGEELDGGLLDRAFADLSRADLLLVLGSSLTVPPAAHLPLATRHGGGDIVIVNRQPTMLDEHAVLRFDDLGAVFGELAKHFSRA